LFEPTTPAADVMPIVERALQLLHASAMKFPGGWSSRPVDQNRKRENSFFKGADIVDRPARAYADHQFHRVS
jgi:hypothetical protein